MTENRLQSYIYETPSVFSFLPGDPLTSVSNEVSRGIIGMMAKGIGVGTKVERGHVSLTAKGTIDDSKGMNMALSMYEIFVKYGCAEKINNLAIREAIRSDNFQSVISNASDKQKQMCMYCLEKRNPECVVYSQ